MKIAVCYSGLIRTGCLCATNLFNYFGDCDIDFFIHTWDYENQATSLLDSMHRNSIIWENINSYKPHLLQKTKADKFIEIYQPKSFKIESYEVFENYNKLAISESNPRLLLPLWVSFYRSIEIMKDYQKDNNIQYDYVVKIRPDMLIKPGSSLMKDLVLLEKYEENSLLICNLGNEEQLCESNVFTDDVLFIGRTDTMIKVSNHGSPFSKTHEYFMRFLIKNDIVPYNADTSTYAILRPHLTHLDTNKDFDLIRKEDLSYYLPEDQFIKMFNIE